MTPAGMTEPTRAKTALASPGCPPTSRWPAGTLAAAETIPARTMNAYATLVISQGHHPADHRSAIPTRAYDSGRGHGHDAAPAGYPTGPVRHQPGQSEPRAPGPGRPVPAPGRPRQRRLRPRPGERSAHLDPGHRSRDPWQPSRTRDQTATLTFPASPHDTTPQTTKNQAQDLQSLDVPLHMSAQIPSTRANNQQVSVMSPLTVHDREPSQVIGSGRLVSGRGRLPRRGPVGAPATGR
jgi:hypothetical protein